MVKAIIFDITGVLFPIQPWVGEKPARDELIKIKKIAGDIYVKGKISKEFLKEKIFQANRPQKELGAVYNSLTVIDEDVFNLIKNLSIKYPLYSIANDVENWTDIRKDIFGFDKYFKKLYISVELGMRKPDEGIYKLLIDETGLKPEECLFIDDKPINVEAAQKLGFEGFVYKDFESLKEFLVNNGIYIK